LVDHIRFYPNWWAFVTSLLKLVDKAAKPVKGQQKIQETAV